MDKSVDGSRCFNISATALNPVRGIEKEHSALETDQAQPGGKSFV
jgi:hypothetical protein